VTARSRTAQEGRPKPPLPRSPEQIIENAGVPRGKAIKVDRLHLELARRSGEVHSMLRQRLGKLAHLPPRRAQNRRGPIAMCASSQRANDDKIVR
jgi:hypothetical protein